MEQAKLYLDEKSAASLEITSLQAVEPSQNPDPVTGPQAASLQVDVLQKSVADTARHVANAPTITFPLKGDSVIFTRILSFFQPSTFPPS